MSSKFKSPLGTTISKFLSDHTLEAAAAREISQKAMHRALLLGTLLLLAHILDIRPSEVEAAGLKFSVKDPSVVYGAISLGFLYQIFHSISRSHVGEALFPLQVAKLRLRTYTKIVRNTNRRKKTPQEMKSDIRTIIYFINVFLFPYRSVVVIIMFLSFIVSIQDLFYFVKFVVTKSNYVSGTWVSLFDFFG